MSTPMIRMADNDLITNSQGRKSGFLPTPYGILIEESLQPLPDFRFVLYV